MKPRVSKCRLGFGTVIAYDQVEASYGKHFLGEFMATTTIKAGSPERVSKHSEFSLMQRVALRRLHPVSIMLDLASIGWTILFLWQHNWQYALATVLIARTLSLGILWQANLHGIADTILGKIALLHLHPVNVVVQTLGGFGAIYGLWVHSTVAIMTGVSALFIGHLFGWSKVDPRLAVYKDV